MPAGRLPLAVGLPPPRAAGVGPRRATPRAGPVRTVLTASSSRPREAPAADPPAGDQTHRFPVSAGPWHSSPVSCAWPVAGTPPRVRCPDGARHSVQAGQIRTSQHSGALGSRSAPPPSGRRMPSASPSPSLTAQRCSMASSWSTAHSSPYCPVSVSASWNLPYGCNSSPNGYVRTRQKNRQLPGSFGRSASGKSDQYVVGQPLHRCGRIGLGPTVGDRRAGARLLQNRPRRRQHRRVHRPLPRQQLAT
jgi:hypothetical protein